MADSPPGPPQMTGVPFSFFCSLVREMATTKPCPTKARARARPAAKDKKSGPDYPALDVFKLWVARLREKFSPLPPGTTAICFRLLFPEEDWKRKYNIQEARMAQLLAECLCLNIKYFEEWQHEEASGCFGEELRLVLNRSCPYEDGFISPISIAEVAGLLDELAATSAFSHASIHLKYPKGRRRPRALIMRKLFRGLAPMDAGVLTQIILKDLRPLLYPLTEFHYTTALVDFNTAAVKMLTKEHAMGVWDPSGLLSRFYRVRASIDEAGSFAEQPANTHRDVLPAVGQPIAIPKSEKGQNCAHALDVLFGSESVWAETKYDGERAQIHVKISEDGSSHITIFSKSKRESTHDRDAVHDIVRAALGLALKSSGGIQQKNPSLPEGMRHNVILDAEMVAFCGDRVAEFWHIAQLIEDTAKGVRARKRSAAPVAYEHESLNSQDNEDLSLGLVFFDILYLDSKSLLGFSYTERRSILQSLIHVEPGSAILAARYHVPMSTATTSQAEDALRWIFTHHLAAHEEGLVLKASESRYNDYRLPWVKLKKDYIPGHGDGVDMVILGASWEKVRGRSLRVSPSAYTTFYVGALENKKEMHRRGFRPKFHAYFTVAYGLNREQLEDLNFKIKSSDPIPYSELDARTDELAFGVTFLKSMKPTVILRMPLLVELFGAGFTKAPHCQHYELRFPRISKIHRPNERSWQESLSLEELHDVASQSVGRERSRKASDDIVNILFGNPVSPGIKSKEQYVQRMICAYNKLATSEGKPLCGENGPRVIPEYLAQKNPYPDPVARTSPRRGLGPLASKTNIFQVEASESCFDRIKSPMQLSVRHPPLTPPDSSPTAKSARRSASPELQNQDRAQKKAKTVPPADAVIEAQAPVPTCTPPDIHLDSTLVFFAKPGGKACASWRASKKLVPRALHSVHGMLAGCGWTPKALEVVNEDIKKGVVVIDECDPDAERWWSVIRELLMKESGSVAQRKRVEVLVYGCRSADALDRFV